MKCSRRFKKRKLTERLETAKWRANSDVALKQNIIKAPLTISTVRAKMNLGVTTNFGQVCGWAFCQEDDSKDSQEAGLIFRRRVI